jgi:uncharacterized protein YecT (DUF1311 family)
MLNIVASWVSNMPGVVQKIRLGVAACLCVGAIAACRPSADTTEQPLTSPDPPAESTEAPDTEAAAPPAPETETTPAPDGTTAQANAPEQTAPPSQPIPPLPAECNNPQTQMAMNECAQAEYDQVDTRLNNVYQSVKASLGSAQTNQLITAEQAWLDFRDAYCDFVQTQYTGGSIQPTVYYGCLTQLTSDRIAALEQTKGGAASYQAVDQELNAVYQDLQGYLSPQEQELLTDAQLAWIDYRDAHCAFEGGDTNACLAQVTDTRVQQLRQQLDVRSM